MVEVDENRRFPDLLVSAFDVHATLVVDKELENYIASPNKKTKVNIGPSQKEMFEKTIGALFSNTSKVTDKKDVTSDTLGLIITPKVQELQTAIPKDSKLNVYEVWIKYQFDISDNKGNPIADWFMPAYGKTPTSFLRSKEKALELATAMALRDAAANISMTFHRIPEVSRWLEKNDINRVDHDG